MLLAMATLLMAAAGCGHYPAPIHSSRDIDWASSSEYMVVLVSLPLEDWPKLQKFAELEHFRVAEEMAAQVRDDHLIALSRLKLPKLRQISFANCSHVTDAGIEALTNVPSIQGLQLIGVGITDRGMRILATEFPHLTGFNVEGCRSLTANGFMSLTNSKTITDVGLSFDPFSQEQIENIISTVSNVTWWTISDPRHRLDHALLRQLGELRKITIQVVDENNSVTGITRAQQGGVAEESQPVRAETNQTSPAAGARR